MDRRHFIETLAAVGALGFTSRLAAQAPAVPGGGVATSTGRVRGLTVGGVTSFKGIPYGEAPVGRRRFMPPLPAAVWSGVRDAFAFGPRAPQPPRAMIPEIGDALVGSGTTGEACLSLNVWTAAARPARPRPVIVWFHGGAYRSGSANSIFYDGSALAAKHDVVVVTVNHRLNVLGFLDLSAFGDERYAQSANAGLLDLVLALRWVSENVAAFGGDPGNVTIMGQSGGGGKVSMLLAMPAAHGLFDRAIVMSTLVESGARGLTPPQSRAATERFLARLQVTPATIAKLHDMPVDTLMAALPGGRGIATGTTPGSGDADDLSTSFYPVVDGQVLPAHPFDPAAPAMSAAIPILTGSDETEGIPYGDPADPYWTTEITSEAALLERIKTTLRVGDADARALSALYRGAHPDDSLADLAAIVVGDNSGSRLSSRMIAERKAAQGGAPAYLYYFKWRSPVRGGKLRSMHSMELPFVWDHVESFAFMTGRGAERMRLARAMSTAFMEFARTGTPAVPGVPAWSPFDPQRRPTLVFDTDSRLMMDPYGEVRAALDTVRGGGHLTQ